MSKIIFHSADTRGHTKIDWLDSYHSFSFGHFYDPAKMGFGLLRVLNDDRVAPSQGFETHGHNDMEIVSIPLSGSLRHKDSQGNEHILKPGDIQIMSAGTGILHSEFNNSDSEPVDFLQIWVRPSQKGLKPSYGQKSFKPTDFENNLQVVVSPDEPSAVQIHQNATFLLGNFEAGQRIDYKLRSPSANGLYVFLIDGRAQVLDSLLGRRDAVGLTEIPSVAIDIKEKASVLLIEVPLS